MVYIIIKIQLVTCTCTCSFLSPPCHFFEARALQTEGFQNPSAETALELCWVRRGSVLKELSICSAADGYKHLEKLLLPKRKDKSLLLWKLGVFQGCWCASKGSRARIDNHDRRISKRLRTTYATSARLTHQVLLPGAHNLGMHSVCHSYHLLAPTRTISRTAYSYVQREERQPRLREICHLPRICCVSANLAHSWELAGHAWGIALTQQEQKNCFAHNYPKTAGSLSQRLKRRHTENLGVRLQERDRFRLQKTGCREEFMPAASVTLHTDVLLYGGECT